MSERRVHLIDLDACGTISLIHSGATILNTVLTRTDEFMKAVRRMPTEFVI